MTININEVPTSIQTVSGDALVAQIEAARDQAVASALSASGAAPGIPRAQVNLGHVVFGPGDSLTDGTSDYEYVAALKNSIRATFGFGGFGYSDLEVFRGLSYYYGGGWGPSYGGAFTNHALAWGGVGVDDISSGSAYVGFGPQSDWTRCRIFYMRQPGGGTFRVRHANEPESVYIAEVATANSTVAIAHVDVTRNSTGGADLSIISGGVAGPVWIIGAAWYLDNGLPICSKVAYGGKKAQDYVEQDAASTSYIMSNIGATLFITELGMNDRLTRTASQIVSDVATLVGRMPSSADKLLIACNEASDDATSALPAYRTALAQYARDNRFGFYNVANLLGSYSAANSAGYMRDVVHPSQNGFAVKAAGIARYLGVPSSAPATPLPAYSGGGSVAVVAKFSDLTPISRLPVGARATATLWTLGFINGYPGGVLELTVSIQRTGHGACRRKRHLMFVAGGPTVGNAASVSDVTTISEMQANAGDGATADYSISAAIVSNRLVISVTENAATAAAFELSAEGRITWTGGDVAGTAVYEY